MELKNKGQFTVLYHDFAEKYIIAYNERGIVTELENHIFNDYDVAVDYITDNICELDNEITELKEAEQRRLEEEEAERARLEEEERIKQEEKAKKKKQFAYNSKRFIAGFLAAVITLVGGHFVGKGISTSIKENKDNTSTSQDVKDEPNKDIVKNDITNIIEKDEELNTENFLELTANFSKQYVDNNVNVTTEDLAKFVSIVNIDKLVEENQEFAKELFGTQAKEEYLGDAAKVIGVTYTYNRNIFEKEQSTKNFIRISDSVYGEQKELLEEIESYVDSIAENKDNAPEVNRLINELLQKMGDPTSELSYLDDGVGFGMQVYVELIRSYLAKDVISKENFDMLTILTSSEKYISNIFTTYDGCVNVDTKTLTK